MICYCSATTEVEGTPGVLNRGSAKEGVGSCNCSLYPNHFARSKDKYKRRLQTPSNIVKSVWQAFLFLLALCYEL